MKEDKKLGDLLDEIKIALEEKEKADKAIIHAEYKRKRAHYNYLSLVDSLRSKEFVI